MRRIVIVREARRGRWAGRGGARKYVIAAGAFAAAAVALAACQTLGGVFGGRAEAPWPDTRAAASAGTDSRVDAAIPAERLIGVKEEPRLRVRIVRGDEGGPARFESAQGAYTGWFWVREAASGSRGKRVPGPVRVGYGATGWSIRDGKGREVSIGSATRDLEIAAEGDGAGAPGIAMVNDAPHRGVFTLRARPMAPGTGVALASADSSGMGAAVRAEGGVDVIETVGLEDYLPGVVLKELLKGWPAEAFRAQAVAARSYAIHEMLRSRALGQVWDVESTDTDQVYGGATDDAAANDAVRSTRGVVLAFGPTVLRAYYSSTCGGRAASAGDIWPTGRGMEFNMAAPLQAKARECACEKSPLHTWEVRRSRREIETRLRAYGERTGMAVRKIGELAGVEVLGTNAVGRPTKYKVIEKGGKWYEMTAEHMRLALNTSVPGFDDVDRRTRAASGDLVVTVAGDEATIRGRGFGHGVGMCQYGAAAMASRGVGWRWMLEQYYPGARVVKAY